MNMELESKFRFFFTPLILTIWLQEPSTVSSSRLV